MYTERERARARGRERERVSERESERERQCVRENDVERESTRGRGESTDVLLHPFASQICTRYLVSFPVTNINCVRFVNVHTSNGHVTD